MEKFEDLLGLEKTCIVCQCGTTCENKPRSKLQGVQWHENICSECTGDPCPCPEQQNVINTIKSEIKDEKIEESCECPEESEFEDALEGEGMDLKDKYETLHPFDCGCEVVEPKIDTTCVCADTPEKTCKDAKKEQEMPKDCVTSKLKCIYDRTNLCECSSVAMCHHSNQQKDFSIWDFVKKLTKPKCRCEDELCNCNDILKLKPNQCLMKGNNIKRVNFKKESIETPLINCIKNNITEDNEISDINCICGSEKKTNHFPCLDKDNSKVENIQEQVLYNDLFKNFKSCECNDENKSKKAEKLVEVCPNCSEKEKTCIENKREKTQACECKDKQETGFFSSLKSLFDRKTISSTCDQIIETVAQKTCLDINKEKNDERVCKCERAESEAKVCDCVLDETRMQDIESMGEVKKDENLAESSSDETFLRAEISVEEIEPHETIQQNIAEETKPEENLEEVNESIVINEEAYQTFEDEGDHLEEHFENAESDGMNMTMDVSLEGNMDETEEGDEIEQNIIKNPEEKNILEQSSRNENIRNDKTGSEVELMQSKTSSKKSCTCNISLKPVQVSQNLNNKKYPGLYIN